MILLAVRWCRFDDFFFFFEFCGKFKKKSRERERAKKKKKESLIFLLDGRKRKIGK